MKKVLLTITLVAATFVALAQGNYTHFFKNIQGSDEAEFKEFYYNEDNHLAACHYVTRLEELEILDTMYYDNQYNLISLVAWQYLDNHWFDVYRIDYTYDNNGNRTSRKNYNHDSDGWFLGGEYRYFYDGNGFMNHWEMYFGDFGLWQQCDRTADENGNVILEMIDQYNMGTHAMTPAVKNEYTYDAEGRITSKISYSCLGGIYSMDMKLLYTYDSSGNMVEQQAINGYYQLQQKRILHYNMDILSEKVIYPENPEEEWPTFAPSVNAIDYEEFWYADQAGTLQYIRDYNYSYSEIHDNVAENEILNVVYPNPAKEVLTIESENNSFVEVIDVTGRKIFESEIDNKLIVNTINFNNGIYFVKFDNGKVVKVLIEK